MSETGIRSALSAIPSIFVDALIEQYAESQKDALRGDWEKVGLKAGKICEIAYCILEGICTGIFPIAIKKPSDMQAACRALEQQTSNGAPRSARVQIPRVIAATYELRNNRAIGHASGDVSPNKMDGLFFHQSIKWIVSELIRVDGRIGVNDASKLVNALNVRWSAAIWEQDGRKRLLMKVSPRKDTVLATLYFSEFAADLSDLKRWLDIKNTTNFINRELNPLHKEAMIDFDKASGRIQLLPPGIEYFEEKYLKT